MYQGCHDIGELDGVLFVFWESANSIADGLQSTRGGYEFFHLEYEFVRVDSKPFPLLRFVRSFFRKVMLGVEQARDFVGEYRPGVIRAYHPADSMISG
jgi:hypothetical protein